MNKIDEILNDKLITNLEKIISVQTLIHSNFTEDNIKTMNPRQLDKHLFERTNLAIEELVEANRELKHRKPHRVTVNGVPIDSDSAVTDIKAFKSELIDATQIIFSVLGALGTTEEEFMNIWREKVDAIKHLTAGNKYEQKSSIEEDYINH